MMSFGIIHLISRAIRNHPSYQTLETLHFWKRDWCSFLPQSFEVYAIKNKIVKHTPIEVDNLPITILIGDQA